MFELFAIVIAFTSAGTIMFVTVNYLQEWRAASNAKEIVRSILNDPDSAQFRKARFVGANYCGEVNAKTAQGGYPGYVPFVAAVRSRKVFVQGQPGFEEQWSTLCNPNTK